MYSTIVMLFGPHKAEDSISIAIECQPNCLISAILIHKWAFGWSKGGLIRMQVIVSQMVEKFMIYVIYGCVDVGMF